VGNWIEPAKTSRSKCVTCDKPIEKGAPRLSEETHDIGIPTLIQRYYHLRCALATAPDVLRRALADVRGDLVIPERVELEAKLEEKLAFEAAKRREKYDAAVAAEREANIPKQSLDPVTFQLTEQLLDNPEDPGALAVLADQLQSTSDPRGELIAVQLALAAAGPRADLLDDDEDEADDEHADALDDRDREIIRQLKRRRVLLERFALPIDPNDRCFWGVGFVRRLELIAKTNTRLSAQVAIWRNPSVRLLSELHVTFVSDHDSTWTARLVDLVPPSLRRLELGRAPSQPLPGLHDLVAVLPRLSSLSLVGQAELEHLAHPTLTRLELGLTGATGQTEIASMILRLQPKKLPGLTELALRPVLAADTRLICDALVTSGWMRRLKHLAFHNAHADSLVLLEPALVKRKLARLDLTGTPVRAGFRDQLAKLAKELVTPDLVAAEVTATAGAYVLHTNKPEWGRGRIVRRFDGKLEIEFPEGGTKVLKADAPFLQVVEG
jgi:hypothetical protein